MKTLKIFFVYSFFLANFVLCGEKVGFFHGLHSSGGTWTNSQYSMIGNLQQSWPIIPINPTRATNIGFSVQADAINLSIPSSGYIAVSHSMGAPAIRTYLKNYGTSAKVKSLVTLSGANSVAYIARSIWEPSPYGGTYVSWFLDRQTIALAGPLIAEIASWGWFTDETLDIISNLYNAALVVVPEVLAANQGMYDLGGLSNAYANIQSEGSFPKVGIIGRETDYEHEFYRIAFSFAGGSPGNGAAFQDILSDTYEATGWLLYLWGEYYDTQYFDDGSYNYDYNPFTASSYYLRAYGFWDSSTLLDLSAEDWKRINGSWTLNGDVYYSDGVLPEFTQKYYNAGDLNNIYVQGNTNHVMVTKNSNGKDAIDVAFSKIPFNNTPFIQSVFISPSPAQAPAGGSYTFTANISGGSGNFTIDWYYYYPGGGPIEKAISSDSELSGNDADPNLPPGTGGWKYKGTGVSTTFQPIAQNKLKAVVKDNITGVIVEAINQW